jgi:hypothetical protein
VSWRNGSTVTSSASRRYDIFSTLTPQQYSLTAWRSMKNARRNRANWLNTLTASLRRETLRQELNTGVVVSATSSSFEMDEYRACTSILIPTIQARMRRGFDGVRSVAAKVELAAYARSERSMALRSGSHPVITSKSKAIRYPWRYVAHAGCGVDGLFFK